MFINTETTVIFPRQLLCFEVGLSKIKDKTGLKEMVEGIISCATSESALMLLDALFGLGSVDKTSFHVEAIHFNFSRQVFQFMVSSPLFPNHHDGSEVMVVTCVEGLVRAVPSWNL